jgi:NADH-quinone oxidoreductase subunit B
MTELPSPTPSKILRPGAGAPDNSSDPYFMQIRDDLSDKGFFTATAEELITWARTGSLMWMTFGLACCARSR